jgi:acetyl-CoA carboxylase biotin carboxyl carrier protein
MELNIVKKLIELLEGSKLKKMHIKDGEFELSLEKDDLETLKKNPAIQQIEKPAPIVETASVEKKVDEKNYVLSPMVGTYYSASAPDQPTYVKVGDKVEENTIICIIEAMKVMNEIKANKKGMIKEVLIENASPVEFGTKLFRIE